MSEFETILEMLASLERGQTQLRADIIAKLERVQGELISIREDMDTNMGRIDVADRDNDTLRKDIAQMREELSVQYRQIKRLQTDVRELKGE